MALNHMITRVLAALAVLTVTACGPLNRESPAMLARDAILRERAAAAPAAPDAPITRATFEASPVPLILAARAEEDAVFLMAQTGRNGAMDTFRDEAGRSLSLRNGIIAGSRGFGDDLMGADTAPIAAALRAGSGRYTRDYAWLGPLDEIRRETYACEVVVLGTPQIALFGQQIGTREIGEVCLRGEAGFANNYWVSGGGTVVQSRQWVSPLIGYVDIQRP